MVKLFISKKSPSQLGIDLMEKFCVNIFILNLEYSCFNSMVNFLDNNFK